MSATLDTVQGLWIGSALTTMERLSIASFLAHGHPFHLYTYDEIANAPQGTTLRDAAEMVPRERIFRWPDKTGSYAAFADYFRYHLLFRRGGWWADVDTVCLRPLRFNEECVVASERIAGCRFTASNIFRFPAGHVAMDMARRICDATDPLALHTCEVGPLLMDWLVRTLRLQAFVQAPEVFCPIPCNRVESLLQGPVSVPDSAATVHLWNEAWSDRQLDKERNYPAESLYERLKRSYVYGT